MFITLFYLFFLFDWQNNKITFISYVFTPLLDQICRTYRSAVAADVVGCASLHCYFKYERDTPQSLRSFSGRCLSLYHVHPTGTQKGLSMLKLGSSPTLTPCLLRIGIGAGSIL